MAIQHPDIQPAVNHSVQVAIAGAGPVGLMMANYLGQMGIDVLVVENGKKTYREFDQILRELPRGDRRKSCFRKIKKAL